MLSDAKTPIRIDIAKKKDNELRRVRDNKIISGKRNRKGKSAVQVYEISGMHWSVGGSIDAPFCGAHSS